MERVRTFLLFATFALLARAQSVEIYSELQRPSPFGGIISQDRSPSPREIISPATARNAYTSFHIAVSVPPGQTFFLYAQANPPDIVTMRLYKEQFVPQGADWIPDNLIPIATFPTFGAMPDGIPGQTTRNYLLDIWTPPNAEVNRRVRIEVLLKYGTWYVTPFELRIMDATVPNVGNASPEPLPSIDEPADTAAVHALAGHFSGHLEWNPATTPPHNIREVLRRNAQQDMALAAYNPDPRVWQRAATQIINSWTFFPNGAEWYLRIRDLLFSRPRP
jgi:hypothetical protein